VIWLLFLSISAFNTARLHNHPSLVGTLRSRTMAHAKPLTVGGIGATPSLDDVVSVARGHAIALDSAGSERIKKESPSPKAFQPEPAATEQQPAAAAAATDNSSSSGPWPACLTPKQARAVLITRLLTLMNGKSGIRLQVADFLKELLNRDLIPALPATDDWSALTVVANACKGEEASTAGAASNGTAAAAAADLTPPGISAAERAVLTSGAAAAAGVGSLVIVSGRQLLTAVTAVAALSCEAAGAQVCALVCWPVVCSCPHIATCCRAPSAACLLAGWLRPCAPARLRQSPLLAHVTTSF
jgi:hypothetical protein